MATPEIMHVHPLIEEILDEHRDHARGDDSAYADYKGHVYRVLNFARALVGESDDAETDDKLAIAAAFHDIDAFSGLDYLAPSIRTQDAWLRKTGREAWADELAVVIAEHHRLTPYKGPHARLAEAFRKADLVDVSQSLIRSGIPRAYVREVRAAFDVGSFFTRTIPLLVVRRLLRNPLDPMPHHASAPRARTGRPRRRRRLICQCGGRGWRGS